MLHIHSGDCSADEARARGVPGRHLPWREALVVGPIAGDRDALFAMRRSYHAAALEAEARDYDADITAVLAALDGEPGELNLWFDEDLFCQVNLWFLLHELARGGRTSVMLSSRRLITRDEIQSGAAAWRAYTSDDPRQIEREIARGSHFAQPLRLHLTRYPSVANGLGSVEQLLLNAMNNGARNFEAVFLSLGDAGTAFGFGDLQVFEELKRLADGPRPLLNIQGDFPAAEVLLTENGKSVLASRADFVELNGIDRWLGGVHLHGRKARWRWDGNALVERP